MFPFRHNGISSAKIQRCLDIVWQPSHRVIYQCDEIIMQGNEVYSSLKKSLGEIILKTTVSAKMDTHTWKRSRLFKSRLATDCARETLLYPASASWCVFEMPVCFTSKSNPRDHWNNISHGRSPDLSPFSDCLPNRWAVSDTDCVLEGCNGTYSSGSVQVSHLIPF